jgi:hypothetical protein
MGIKPLITGILFFSRLCIQSLGLITQAIIKRQKAKSTFKKTLMLQGVPPKTARELAETYPNPLGEILNLVRSHASRLRISTRM